MRTQNRMVFRVYGLDCIEEIKLLRRTVGPLVNGEENLSFDLLTAQMTILTPVENPQAFSQSIIQTVAKTGLRAEVFDHPQEAAHAGNPMAAENKKKRAFTVASGIFLLLGVMIPQAIAQHVFFGFSCIAAFWCLKGKIAHALRHRRLDINLLMLCAVAGAVVLNDWVEAASVSFLYALSLVLESYSLEKAHRAVSSLLKLTPQEAIVLKPGCCSHDPQVEVSVPIESVLIHSHIVIKPGARIPLDGKVISGESEVDQAPITGESLPRAVSVNDRVFAGSINGAGVLTVETVKNAADSTIQKTLRLINEAQCKKAPSEQWIDGFARIYTPVVLGLALLTALVLPFLTELTWRESLYRALVLLVISCPCALVLSTPISIIAGLSSAAKNGILIKGGRFLEAFGKTKVIVFDKTGTFTQGILNVTALKTLQGHSEDEVLQRAASIGAQSQHHLAKGVVRLAMERGLALFPTEHVQNHVGLGVSAALSGKHYWLGSKRMLAEKFANPSDHLGADYLEDFENFQSQGQSVVAVGNSEHVCGFLSLQDQPRAEAQEALSMLRKKNIRHLALLTGDSKEAAQAIKEKYSFDEVASELFPDDKVKRILELNKQFGEVTMVGDGINDAPALSASTVGVAMAGPDSDTAIEHADVTLLTPDLRKIPWLMAHSQRVVRVIRQNVAIALGLKVCFLTLTLLGLSSLWGAIVADVGATLLVIFNGLRLLRP